MANKRITELVAATSSSLDSQDLLLVVDRSISETQNITVEEFSGYIADNVKVLNALHSDKSSVSEYSTVAITATESEHSVTSDTSISSSFSDISMYSFKGGSSTSPFLFPSFTELERNNMTNIPLGSVIYNTTGVSFQGYTATGWKDLS